MLSELTLLFVQPAFANLWISILYSSHFSSHIFGVPATLALYLPFLASIQFWESGTQLSCLSHFSCMSFSKAHASKLSRQVKQAIANLYVCTVMCSPERPVWKMLSVVSGDSVLPPHTVSKFKAEPCGPLVCQKKRPRYMKISSSSTIKHDSFTVYTIHTASMRRERSQHLTVWQRLLTSATTC